MDAYEYKDRLRDKLIALDRRRDKLNYVWRRLSPNKPTVTKEDVKSLIREHGERRATPVPVLGC